MWRLFSISLQKTHFSLQFRNWNNLSLEHLLNTALNRFKNSDSQKPEENMQPGKNILELFLV